MENAPYIPYESTPPPQERDSSPDDKEKKDKKKRKSPEFSSDIGRSIFKRETDREKSTKAKERQSILKAELESPKQVGEKAAPVEWLSDEEAKTVSQALAAERLEAVTNERVSPEQSAAENFNETVVQDGDVDAAFAETALELGASTEEIDELLADESEAEAETPEDEAFIDPREPGEGEFALHPDDTAEEPEAAPSAGGGSTGNGSGGGNSTGAGTPGGGGSPPGPVPGAVPPYGGAAGGGWRATAPAGPNPNVVSVEDAYYYARRAQTNGLIVGGILGYLIGRRRGRIKTERRLLPIQKKLEKQVENLDWQLADREAKLRRLATERQRTVATRSVIEARPLRGVAVPERIKQTSTESRLGLNKPVGAERLGQMIIAAEAPERTRIKYERPNSIRQAFRPEEVKDMKHNELLELSEKVVVEGATLRQIYEAHLVGEHQLRHLVSEYLRGKDIRRELRHEMIEREIDFERDPILRDRARSSVSGGGNVALNRLLEKAGVLQDDEESPELKARAEFEAQQAARQKRQRKVIDTSLVTAIAVLFALVIYLLLQH